MNLKKYEIVDVGEYKIIINYEGNGTLGVTVLDELGDEIEGIYISDVNDDDESDDMIDINLN